MKRGNAHTPPDTAGGWQFKADDPDDQDAAAGITTEVDTAVPTGSEPEPPVARSAEISWTASEFIAHEKGIMWYLKLMLVAIVVTVIIYLLTRDKISSGVVLLAAIVFGAYGARKPRTLEYRLDVSGLTIADKLYDYGQFRSFWTTKEGAFSSITFMPLKRFMPALTVYYSPQDEQQIMQILERHLPMENRDRDLLDRFLHHIRF